MNKQLEGMVETIDALRRKVTDEKIVYIGTGSWEVDYGVSQHTLRMAYTFLKENEDYQVRYLRENPEGTGPTTEVIKLLTGPNTTYQEVWDAREELMEKMRATRKRLGETA